MRLDGAAAIYTVSVETGHHESPVAELSFLQTHAFIVFIVLLLPLYKIKLTMVFC